MAAATPEANEETEVDWSELPADLLESISKRRAHIVDLIYFRCVCKRWRTATSISDLPSQIPWLLEDRGLQDDTEYPRFYCILSGKTRTIRCPQSLGKRLQGPSRGYLYSFFEVAEDDWKHCLLNPLTGDEVTIPFPDHPIVNDQASLACMGPDPIGNDHMAFIDDMESGNDQLFHSIPRPSVIGFYQPHHREWYYADGNHGEQYYADESRFSSPGGQACLKGKYYRNESQTGDTVVVDIASGSSFLIPPPESQTYNPYCTVRFVESAGKILRISNKFGAGSDVRGFSFDICQLHVEGENDKPQWVKTSSIGDQILFLDAHSGISVTASQSTGLLGNCIYFFEERAFSATASRWITELYRYNIEDDKAEIIPCPFSYMGTWLVPSVVGFQQDGP